MYGACMGGDDVVSILKRIWGVREELREFKEVGPDSPHGIYFYDKFRDLWVLFSTRDADPFVPRVDGYYVMYFDNARCSACRKYDLHWFPYVRRVSRELKDHYFLIVLCNWFARDCNSSSASITFTYYAVHASPTTVLLYVKDSKERYKESYDGYLKTEELEKVVGGFRSRADAFERGVKVPKPIEEGSDIIKLLRQILLGERQNV